MRQGVHRGRTLRSCAAGPARAAAHPRRFAGDALYLGVGTAISVIIWLTVLIYWTGVSFYRLEGL